MYAALMTLALLTAANPATDTTAKAATPETAIAEVKARAKSLLQTLETIKNMEKEAEQIKATIASTKQAIPPRILKSIEVEAGLAPFSKWFLENQLGTLITALKDIQDKTPTLNKAGDKATFQLTKKLKNETKFRFAKIKGKWYFN